MLFGALMLKELEYIHRRTADTLLRRHAVVHSCVSVSQRKRILPAVVESLCGSLDVSSPTLLLPETDLVSWKWLLHCLVFAAKALTEAYVGAQESNKCFSTASLRGSAPDVNAAASACQIAQLNLESILWDYEMMNRILRKHAWWQEAHLSLPSTPEKVAGDLANGTTNVSSVAVLAAVHAAQTHALQARQVRALRVGGAEEDSALEVYMNASTAVLEALQGSQNTEEAVDLFQAIQLFGRANCLAQNVEEGVVQVSSVMAAWVKEHGNAHLKDGIPAPLRGVHPEIGPILAQPASWWGVFPHSRRERRTPQAVDEML